jgi:hypothetical protein
VRRFNPQGEDYLQCKCCGKNRYDVERGDPNELRRRHGQLSVVARRSVVDVNRKRSCDPHGGLAGDRRRIRAQPEPESAALASWAMSPRRAR